MNLRALKAVSVALLCLYGAAIAHEAVPHLGHHGATQCALCVLLSGVAVVALVAALAVQPRTSAAILIAPRRIYSRHAHTSFSLRGPPPVLA
jgi:hypothetical protein